MGIRAVAFDLGGVLEAVEPAEEFRNRWRDRLGLGEAGLPELLWPLSRHDPDDLAKTGHVSQAQYREHCVAAFGLSAAQADEFMASFWNWYCGTLDTGLADYAASLRPGLRTGILSNSLAGARREEQARFGFEQLVDVIVYSDEAGLAKPDPRVYLLLCAELGVEPGELVFLDNREPNVGAACELGIHGLLYVSTAASIAAIRALVSPAG